MEPTVVDKGTDTISKIMYMAILMGVFLLIIVVIFGAFLLIDVDLGGSTFENTTAANETHLMNGTIGFFTLDNSIVDGYTTVCTDVIVTNATDGVLISSGNYTASSTCIISNLTSTFNLVDWNVSYTATWDTTNSTAFQSSISSVQTDIVGLVTNFFALMPTVGTILAVIILIAAIVILVIYVSKMKNDSRSSKDYTG